MTRLADEVASVAAAARARPESSAGEAAVPTSRFAMRRDGAGPRAAVSPAATGGELTSDPAGSEVVPAGVEAAAEPAAEGEVVPWPDESAESAFLGEARERGEVVVPKKAEDVAEETTAKPLPALDTMVERIPAEVRDALEDLFRAKFVTVKRVPKKALKTT